MLLPGTKLAIQWGGGEYAFFIQPTAGYELFCNLVGSHLAGY